MKRVSEEKQLKAAKRARLAEARPTPGGSACACSTEPALLAVGRPAAASTARMMRPRVRIRPVSRTAQRHGDATLPALDIVGLSVGPSTMIAPRAAAREPARSSPTGRATDSDRRPQRRTKPPHLDPSSRWARRWFPSAPGVDSHDRNRDAAGAPISAVTGVMADDCLTPKADTARHRPRCSPMDDPGAAPPRRRRARPLTNKGEQRRRPSRRAGPARREQACRPSPSGGGQDPAPGVTRTRWGAPTSP